MKSAKKAIELQAKASEGVMQWKEFSSVDELNREALKLQLIKGAFILGWTAIFSTTNQIHYVICYRGEVELPKATKK